MFDDEQDVSFKEEAVGIWGSFDTPSGSVTFLSTKARLARSGDLGREVRLTRFLRPVREVLDTQDMDFNQLLQRDLDDHRVATELVPYLMRQSATTGPAFFPPILVGLLPFEGLEPKDRFPERHEIDTHSEEGFGLLQGYRHGEAYRFERLMNKEGRPHSINLGRLGWNDERTKLVVLDGQHRAMALLAIYRTLNRQWDGEGEKYKHFYEQVVEAEVERLKDSRDELFAGIELPVTLIWFPTKGAQQNISQQLTARKLFVDVNKNARAPSEARILLLTDTHLTAIFTRRILNAFRATDDATLPIFAIEYDHPERNQASVAKWSTITNVTILQACVLRTVFGPADYIHNVTQRLRRGRENTIQGGEFMRATLRVSTFIPDSVEENGETIERESICDDIFPRSKLDELETAMMSGWGTFIVRVLSDVLPYKAHGIALKLLRGGWSTAGTSALARDAVFEGVGMYWTLRDSVYHWKKTNQLRQDGEPDLPKTDIVDAWEFTVAKRGQFEEIRSSEYLGSKSKKHLERSREAFETFSTFACQVGLALTGRSVAWKGGVAHDDVARFAEDFVRAINAGLTDHDVHEGLGRRFFLISSGVKSPFNRIRKLDSPMAFLFRYFWLELISTPESAGHLKDWITPDELHSLRDHARVLYLDHLRSETRKSLKQLNPAWNASKLDERAAIDASSALSSALEFWFQIERAVYDQWEADFSSKMIRKSTDETEEGIDEEENADLSPSEPTLDDLLNGDENE